MILSKLSESELTDAAHEAEARIARASLVTEGYGRTYDMKYSNWHHDPKPLVLTLGYYTHPNTGNRLLCGVNLNTLQPDQIEQLRKALPKILRAGKNSKIRYRVGRRLLPDVFEGAYRTYNTDYIDQISPGTLRFWNPKGDFRQERARLLELEKERLKKRKAKKAGKTHDVAIEPAPEPEMVQQPTQQAPMTPQGLKQDLAKKALQPDLARKRGVEKQVTGAPVTQQGLVKQQRAEKKAEALQNQVQKQKQIKQASREVAATGPEGPEGLPKLGVTPTEPQVVQQAVQPQQMPQKPKEKPLAKKPQRPEGPFESYIRRKPVFADLSVSTIICHIPTGRVIADHLGPLQMLTEANWDIDESIIYEKSNDWVAEHHYPGFDAVEGLAEAVGQQILANMES